MEDYDDDGPWMWVAFAPGSRLIVDFHKPRKTTCYGQISAVNS